MHLPFKESIPELRVVGALGGIRIPNLLIRSQMLYPIELRVRVTERRTNLARRRIDIVVAPRVASGIEAGVARIGRRFRRAGSPREPALLG
jgi:hypothetical protein